MIRRNSRALGACEAGRAAVLAAVAPQLRDFRVGDVRHSLADIGRMRALPGDAPTNRLDAGLAASIGWYPDYFAKRGAAWIPVRSFGPIPASARPGIARTRQRILPEIVAEQRIQGRVSVRERLRCGEERLGGHREELSGVGGGVRIEWQSVVQGIRGGRFRVDVARNRRFDAVESYAEIFIGCGHRVRPAGAHPGRQRRRAVGRAVDHVELVREFVDHHVVARMGAGGVGIGPGQHDRTTLHRLAGEFVVVLVHDAGLVDLFARCDEAIGIHDDFDEIAVAGQAQMQCGQAGLQRDRDAHFVVDHEAGGAAERLGREKRLALALQQRAFGLVQMVEERQTGRDALPLREVDRFGSGQAQQFSQHERFRGASAGAARLPIIGCGERIGQARG